MSPSPSYRIGITFPPHGSVGTGNLRTAERWQRILSELGHEVEILAGGIRDDRQVLIALNAVKSAEAISRFHAEGQGKLIVAVTGTDLNKRDSQEWKSSMAYADAIVVLQEKARETLEANLQQKTHLIVQSVAPLADPGVREEDDAFQVCQVGHLRAEKDPLLAAQASRLLDENSKVQIHHAGAILEDCYRREVEEEQYLNPRYHWLGELDHVQARSLIAQSDLIVLSSTSEGGPGVIGEAVRSGTPILSTRIDGALGLLGEDYPGYFRTGDVEGLSRLLTQAETDEGFYSNLRIATESRKALFDPEVEKEGWRRLLAEVSS